MYLPDFDYYAPESLREANDLLMRLGPSAKVLAGGTDILVKMKSGLLAPSVLVSLKNLHELRRIRSDADRGLAIGALATHNEICNSAVVQERFLSLDFFRGLTMFLLIGESTLLYEHLRDPRLAGTVLGFIGTQLDMNSSPARTTPTTLPLG